MSNSQFPSQRTYLVIIVTLLYVIIVVGVAMLTRHLDSYWEPGVWICAAIISIGILWATRIEYKRLS